ncbi:8735_t:CDS:2 [Ambispora leptoticha]|uniref:8735_t:CDS:1 n=1 Tax=Ambispora leptoticha TaxID=144679 RepID=A0A9N8WTM2_9GLOM|nr:8735_t:CDS:2 [Ambispora leptoticha]
MGVCCSRRNGKSVEDAKFRYIDGRRYHNISESEYIGANDEEEANRLIQYHEVIKIVWEGLYHSPIENKLENGANVIDIGCGAGIWLLEMAQKYPNSHFVGIDFSPIFPTEGLPKNLKFINCNFLDGVPFEDSYFDFAHQKFMAAAFTKVQWKEKVIPELLRITKSGGWIEFTEAELIRSNGTNMQRIVKGMKKFFEEKDLVCVMKGSLSHLLEDTNAFSEIRNEQKTITLGKKGDYIGQETLKFYMRAITSGRIILSSFMDVMPEHFDALAETAFIETENSDTFGDQLRICCHKL